MTNRLIILALLLTSCVPDSNSPECETRCLGATGEDVNTDWLDACVARCEQRPSRKPTVTWWE